MTEYLELRGEQRGEGFLLDDGAGSFGVEKTVGKFLIPHNLLEFIFGEQRGEDRQLGRTGGGGSPRNGIFGL